MMYPPRGVMPRKKLLSLRFAAQVKPVCLLVCERATLSDNNRLPFCVSVPTFAPRTHVSVQQILYS